MSTEQYEEDRKRLECNREARIRNSRTARPVLTTFTPLPMNMQGPRSNVTATMPIWGRLRPSAVQLILVQEASTPAKHDMGKPFPCGHNLVIPVVVGG